MKSAIATRVQKHRSNLRHRGLKPVQIWVPDVRSKGFTDECKRQSMIVRNDKSDQETNDLIASTADLQGWA